MATSEQFQERLRRAVCEAVQKCLAEGGLPEGLIPKRIMLQPP
jgi:hypothetical protein